MSKKLITAKSKSLGSLESWKKETHGLCGVTSLGKFKVQIYNDQVARISVTTEEDFEDFSYAVIAEPDFSPQIKDTGSTLEVQTALFILEVTKNPVRFNFYTLDGKPINEDDPAFGTSWNGEQVTTYKKIQDGERFIG